MNRIGQVSGHLGSSGAYPAGLLAGQVAIITGSGQGIGASAALQFAKEGAKVVVTDIDAAKANAVVAQITNELKGEACAINGDIMDPEFPQKLIEQTVQKYGKVNIIVNNAGFTYDGVIHKMSDKQWDTMLVVHNTAPFRMTRAVAKYWRTKDISEPKVMINVSSTSGLHGNFGQINYATAKAGIVGLTKTVCKEWGPFNVRCNTVAFGYIDTRLTRAKEDGATVMVDGKPVALGIPGAKPGTSAKGLADIPLGRGGTPDEAAASILLLASPLASYVNGHTLEVTGGRGI